MKKTENEVWRDVDGYKGLYQISSDGNVNGQRNPLKLTSDQVRQIKTSSITNKSLLGRMFEVHHTTIEAILEGKTWKHI